jgi:hypothetical protein
VAQADRLQLVRFARRAHRYVLCGDVRRVPVCVRRPGPARDHRVGRASCQRSGVGGARARGTSRWRRGRPVHGLVSQTVHCWPPCAGLRIGPARSLPRGWSRCRDGCAIGCSGAGWSSSVRACVSGCACCAVSAPMPPSHGLNFNTFVQVSEHTPESRLQPLQYISPGVGGSPSGF